jgi:hypothetical protein
LIVPFCSTINRRVASPEGAVKNIGALRFFVTVWSLRLVRAEAEFLVGFSLPQAVNKLTRYRHWIIKMDSLMRNLLFSMEINSLSPS